MGATLPLSFEHQPERSIVEVVAPEQLDNAAGLTAFAYWRMLRGARTLPARADLSPKDMRAILPNVVLLRVIEGGRDYEYRIVGETFVRAYGIQFRGKRLTQVEAVNPEHGARMRNMYEHVRRSANPLALRGWVGQEFVDSRFVYFETVLLPFADDGETVDHLLAVSVHVPKAES